MVRFELRAVYHTRRWLLFSWPRKLLYTPFMLLQWGIAACLYPLFIGLSHLFIRQPAPERGIGC